MTRQTRSTIFTLATSICNIIITLFFVILIGGIFIGISVGLLKVNPQENIIFEVLLPFVFIAALIISLKVYMIFARFVIRVFKLEDKLNPKIIQRYLKKEVL